MGDGQQLFIQTLLPQNSAVSYFNGAANMNPIAELEPTKYIFQEQDPTIPADIRFLHVQQGSDPGVPMAAATHLQSSAGTSLDGAQFGAFEVWFPVRSATPFTVSTFSVPAGVRTVLVTGLSPNIGYSVTTQTSGTGNIVTVSPNGSNATTDAAGVLQLSY
jgi:hypothetical protein